MASNKDNDRSFIAAAALNSTNQYCVVFVTSVANEVGLATSATNSAMIPIGILQNNDVDLDGSPANVRMYGVTKARAGAAIAVAGTELTHDASGAVITVTASQQWKVGTNLTVAAAAGDFIEISLQGIGTHSSTIL